MARRKPKPAEEMTAAELSALLVRPIYTLHEVGVIAHVSRSQIYKAIGQGKLLARKRGGTTLILAEDLWRWLEGLPSFDPGSAACVKGRHAVRQRRQRPVAASV
jgi:hypothetical protein